MRSSFLTILCLLSVVLCAQERSGNDVPANQPMGWATCATHEGGQYPLTGGSNGSRRIVLQSHGGDMREDIMRALTENDVVVLDGTRGDFLIGRQMELNQLRNKTLVGINKARLVTSFLLTPELRYVLDTADVRSYSTRAKGIYEMPNGDKVKEECEYQVRKHLIAYLDDAEETYRMSGVLKLRKSENIIIRNICFQGPGAVDVGGSDLLCLSDNSKHIWVDHCDFRDGMDGNFDIISKSDYITVSWCTFSYSERSYMHMNSNLIGANNNAATQGDTCLNVTYQCCVWGKGCKERMPMVRFGNVHVLNCVYMCEGCNRTINPRDESEVLIEGCVWGAGVTPVIQGESSKAYELRDCIMVEGMVPESRGSVEVPYSYTALPACQVWKIVGGR